MTYGIEEVYLIGTSQVAYNFTIVETQATTSCVANVSILSVSDSIMEFLASGHARIPSESYCLSLNEPLAIQLNSSDGDSYYFVGLESFVSATLNHTVSKDLLEYDITNADNVSCTLSTSSSDCTISLNGEGQEVCVLASLQHTNNTFIYYINHSSDAIFVTGATFAFLGFFVFFLASIIFLFDVLSCKVSML